VDLVLGRSPALVPRVLERVCLFFRAGAGARGSAEARSARV
jgi:hypothetical protein